MDIAGLGDETHEADTTFDTFLVAALCANLRASGPRVALRGPITGDVRTFFESEDEKHKVDATFDTVLVALLGASLRASGPRVALREPTTSDI